ncbi:MAG TPA: 2-phospho-L-lactate guanylyltransferase [Solirubrobacteraceae bacterium]|nr:2-phospho-L-lactate guanylyltransferase [Solirubrobacteraceae bacterium]
MRTLAILPVKSFAQAKQRLSSGLEPPLRRQLAEVMLYDVLSALSATELDEVIVVTAGDAAAEIARDQGARVVVDAEQGHNAAASVGITEALRSAAERVLLVPGDCPALDPDEVNQLLDRPAEARSVIIVPDRHGTGTNALLIRPPDALTPAFGPGSAQRHARLAQAAGIAYEVVEVPSLALDIDTPEDLATLGRMPDQGLRTHGLLSRC